MTKTETIREIKSQFRLYMNGVASASMREKGLCYKVNFGIEIPRLHEIASNYTPDFALAYALWNDPVRESKLLATLLMPRQDMPEETADEWAGQIDNVELAEQATFNLFRHLPCAHTKSLEWIAGENPFMQLCGVLLALHLAGCPDAFSQRDIMELKDQVQVLLQTDFMPVVRAARKLYVFLQQTSSVLEEKD